jgi:hypothetical protein
MWYFNRPTLLVHAVIALSAVSAMAQTNPAAATQPAGVTGSQAIRLAVSLASDLSALPAPALAHLADFLWGETQRLDLERSLALEPFDSIDPDPAFAQIVAAEGSYAIDDLRAMRRSMARFFAAQRDGDRKAMDQQFAATRQYATRAADALDAQATIDDKNAKAVAAKPYGVRHSPEQAKALAEQIKTAGLSADHRAALAASGRNDTQITQFEKALLATPPEQWGFSLEEGFARTAATRRTLAASLRQFAASGAGVLGQPLANVFDVVNPHDRPETIELHIRRVAVPDDWRLAVVDAQPPTAPTAKPLVQEEKPGERYYLKLPANGTAKVASLIIPTGAVGRDTVARWAVEGHIGKELIGGMMHEMTIPASQIEVTLPPIAKPALATATPAGISGATGLAASSPDKAQTFWWIVAPISILVIFFLFFILAKRRRRREPPQPT